MNKSALIARLLQQLAALEESDLPAIPLQQTLDELLGLVTIKTITEGQYVRSLKMFERFLGRPATNRDLTHETLNAWFVWLQAVRGAGPQTVKNYRTGLLRIWNHLVAEEQMQPYVMRKLRVPKMQPKTITAWSPEQLKILLDCCKQMEHRQLKCRLSTGKFLAALLLVAYDTGLRPIDLRQLRWDHLDFATRQGLLVQSKTGNPHCFRLSQQSVNALMAIVEPLRENVFPLGKTGVLLQLRKLFKLAEEYGFKAKRGQSLGVLRKSHATEIYKRGGLAAAAESLGHVSGSAIAKRHYVDSTAQHVGALPPPIQ